MRNTPVCFTVIYGHLHERNRIPEDWFARQINRIDRTDGDIDTLSKRLAYIRTWTYVAQRKGWVGDEGHWRDETRAVEDSLSDALHGASDAKICGPAHQRAVAPAQAEGGPFGRSE